MEEYPCLTQQKKTYKTIMEKRMRNKIESTLEETQSRFRRGYYINDHILP